MNAGSPGSIPNPRISIDPGGSTIKIKIGSVEGSVSSHHDVIPKIHQLQRAWLKAQGETLL